MPNATAARAVPRHNPHTIIRGEEGVSDSKPSSRGAPKWADDPAQVNAELAAMDARDSDRAERKIKSAHIGAHKENIRRGRADAAKTRRAADAAAMAGTPAARARRVQQRAGAVASVLPRSSGLSVSDASGFTLALLAWAWIGLPLLSGGPDAVRNVWRAKFFNKGAGGEPLV